MLSTPDPVVEAIFADPDFAVGFARISTHYALNHGFVPDGSLLAGAANLTGIPSVLVQGRYDLCRLRSPPGGCTGRGPGPGCTCSTTRGTASPAPRPP